ncbi:type II toxin-antitoxin system HipA family toxin [Reyranella sp. CPCC 100927]|uniref:type II toxin-antitoxin system HipA family toxin n=1 Tax=Reyranella sp. CPCC 100927 TaxID=2599616 RepID=UPI0011B7ABEE|nr:HipA domain-containing protein [Reyranella sp. CPCC 100927]TWT11473.1 type II toxin-antitoxin system HipA family toxin [Reyranella sp. CPCC 100927]
MATPDVTVLEVLLHGEVIGTLTSLPGDRSIFAFSEEYIADQSRPLLSLSFKDDLGGLITNVRPTRTRVAPFFANLLPEGAMRQYLADKAGVDPAREFFLIWVLGQDLPGAVRIRQSDGRALPPASAGDSRDRRGAVLRFSLAGVQLKFSAFLEARGGLTISAEGVGGSWVVKLPSASFEGVPENEFSMMSLAKAAGMDVPEVRLVALDAIANLPDGIGRLKGRAFAVRRFDRAADGTAIHMEDFAQIFGVYPDDKYRKASYRNLASVIWAEIGEVGITEFVHRLVFSGLIGNADMHLKNWSLVYPDGRNARLAPAYDFVSTIAYLDDPAMALNVVRTKRRDELTWDELSYLAARAQLPERLVLATAREAVRRFREAWASERKHLPIDAAVARAIERNIATIPIAGGG